MTTTTFPEKLADREKYIFDQVAAGNFEAAWSPLEYAVNGKQVKLNVMTDALKIGGVRVNVSATLQQQLADVFDASLLTAQVADLMFLNAAKRVDPSPEPISSSVKSMINHSLRVDGMVGASTGIIAPPGKHWILDKKIEWSPGKACNYGWHFVGTSFKGIKGHPCASTYRKTTDGKAISVIQPNATAHDAKHSDYSQICQLVSQQCWVDGTEYRFSQLLTDPALAVLVNSAGALKFDRQPNVPLVVGVKVAFPVIITP